MTAAPVAAFSETSSGVKRSGSRCLGHHSGARTAPTYVFGKNICVSSPSPSLWLILFSQSSKKKLPQSKRSTLNKTPNDTKNTICNCPRESDKPSTAISEKKMPPKRMLHALSCFHHVHVSNSSEKFKTPTHTHTLNPSDPNHLSHPLHHVVGTETNIAVCMRAAQPTQSATFAHRSRSPPSLHARRRCLFRCLSTHELSPGVAPVSRFLCHATVVMTRPLAAT